MERRTLLGQAAALPAAALSGYFGAGSPAAGAVRSRLVVRQAADQTVTIERGAMLAAGLARVEISSLFTGADPETFRLHGMTLEEMAVLIAAAGNWQTDAPAAAAAMRRFTDDTTFYGGLSLPGEIWYRTVFEPGCYEINVAQVNNPVATARQFRVEGDTSDAQLPPTNQLIRIVSANEFAVSGPNGHLHAGPLTVTNESDELGFVRLVQVKPGITNDDVSAWFAGTAPDPTLIGGQSLGIGTQSPGRSLVVDLRLEPGDFMALDFIPSNITGVPHAFTGKHAVVTVG